MHLKDEVECLLLRSVAHVNLNDLCWQHFLNFGINKSADCCLVWNYPNFIKIGEVVK